MTDQLAPQTAGTMLAAHVDALNLAGLSFATKRLLGNDPSRVCGQFTMWARQELRPLPSLTRRLWEALSPIGVQAPDLVDAAVCQKVLQGRLGEAEEATTAASVCASTAKTAFAMSPLPPLDQASDQQRAQQRALVNAVKDYWRALGAIYGEVRSRVVTGEHPRAARMVGKAQAALTPTLDHIATLATALAESFERESAGQSAIDTSVAEDVDRQARQRSVEAEFEEEPSAAQSALPRRQPTPLGDRDTIEARAEAFARSAPLREEAANEAPPRPVEVLSTEPVPNRVFAPVIFLLLVAGVALVVIFQVLNAPNPLSGG